MAPPTPGHRVRTSHLVIFGACTGLIATGAGGLFSWLVYGSSNLTEHLPTIGVTALLAVAAGLSANPVVAWLTKSPGSRPRP